MKWAKADVRQYTEAKEFIDTILIPLMPFQLSTDNEMDKTAHQHEVMQVLATEIEKELTGRIMLPPAYSYLKTANKSEEAGRINHWIDDIRKQSFSLVFLITFDPAWKKVEQELDGTLLWLPALQSGDLQSAEMRSGIKDQVQQINELIRFYW